MGLPLQRGSSRTRGGMYIAAFPSTAEETATRALAWRHVALDRLHVVL